MEVGARCRAGRMTLQACAALVERGDPDRFAATLAAPLNARAKLWPIYAFNLEIARAPWVSTQPLIAEMRLQFWRDVLVAPNPPAHEVAGPLHALLGQTAGLAELLDTVVEARRRDIARDPFASPSEFDAYIEGTSATLMWAAALALGADPAAETAFRFQIGHGSTTSPISLVNMSSASARSLTFTCNKVRQYGLIGA